jgi:hypothetical protein
MKHAISNWIYGDEPLHDQYTRLARFDYQEIEMIGETNRFSMTKSRYNLNFYISVPRKYSTT